jgi:hypothetical protein
VVAEKGVVNLGHAGPLVLEAGRSVEAVWEANTAM